MADAITIKALQDASLDAKSLEEVVNGNEEKQVTTRKGETYPSVKKAIKTMFDNGGLPAVPFATKALMTASGLANDSYAMVTDDSVADNNGLYVKTAGAWVKSSYDLLELSKSYTDSKVNPIFASGETEDFNTFTEQATIIFGSPARLPKYLNSPYTYFGIGVAPATMSVTSSGTAVIQVFYGGRTSKLICSRYSADRGATWTEWVRFLNNTDLATVGGDSLTSVNYIPADTDILDFAAANVGKFATKNNSETATMINFPTVLSSRVEITKLKGSIATIIQVLVWDNLGNIWYRTKGGTVWSHDWRRVASSDDIATINEKIDNISSSGVGATSKIDKAIDKGDLNLINGTLVDNKADNDYALFIGSSTIYWAHEWGILQEMFATVPNQRLDGQGGEIIEQHSARMGARKAICQVTGGVIPASGEVGLVTSLPNYKQSSIKQFTGTLNGVTGTFRYSPTLASYSFVRAVAGDAVSSPNSYEFIPNFDKKYLQGYVVINAGKNNFTNSSDSAEYVFNRTVEMVDYMQSTFTRALVLGQFLNRGMLPSSSVGTRILAANEMLKDKYGDKYIDVQSYLMSPQVWIDTGITPTEADLTSQANGYIAVSLSFDSLHMNELTWQALADNVMQPRLQEFGWIV